MVGDPDDQLAQRAIWTDMTGSNHFVIDPVIDLSGDDWPIQLEQLLNTDAALREAFARRHTMARFLSALHGVANQLPTMDGAPHARPTDSPHARPDIDDALALAGEMPADMRAAVRLYVDEFRAMAATHNLAVTRWVQTIRNCIAHLEPLCTGPYRAVAETLCMQVMDRVAQADELASMAQAYRTVVSYAAQLPDDGLDGDDDDDARDHARGNDVADERLLAPASRDTHHVRRLQWTVGVVSCLAAVLVLSFGFMTWQAEGRAQAATADAMDARQQASEARQRASELERRAAQPLRVLVESQDIDETTIWSLPATIEINGSLIAISEVKR